MADGVLPVDDPVDALVAKLDTRRASRGVPGMSRDRQDYTPSPAVPVDAAQAAPAPPSEIRSEAAPIDDWSADPEIAKLVAQNAQRKAAKKKAESGIIGEFSTQFGVGAQRLRTDSMAAAGAAMGNEDLIKQAAALDAAMPAPAFDSISDVGGVYDFMRYVAAAAGGSAPEMGVVTAAGVAGAPAGGIGGFVTGAAAASVFEAGRIAKRQVEERGQVEPWSLAAGALTNGMLNYLPVGKGIGAFSTRMMGAAGRNKALREIGEIMASEALTETAQQVVEQVAGNPDNLRILTNPKGPEEEAKANALADELINSLVAGGVVGGTFGAVAVGGGEVVSRVPSVVNRREQRADEEEQNATQPTNPPPERRPGSAVGIEYDMGPKRPYKPNDTLLDIATRSVESVLGPGAKIVVTSGTEGDLPQHGSNRHKTGNAADVAIYTSDGRKLNVKDDPELFDRLATAFATNGITGMGYGRGYMGGEHIHIDTVGTSGGGGNVWGEGASRIKSTLVPIMHGNPNAAPSSPPPAGFSASQNYYDRLIGVESSGDPNAQNPRSSAGGLGQFIDSTWLDLMRRHRPDLTDGKSDAQIVALKKDAALNKQMLIVFTEENADALRRAQVPVTDASLGVMHRFGVSGGVSVMNTLRTAPDTPVAAIVGPAAMAANPDLEGKTVQDVYDFYASRLGTASSNRIGITADEFLGAVKTVEDKRGTPLADAPQAIQQDAITEQMSRIFGKVVEDKEMPPQMRTEISATLMPNNINPEIRPIDRLSNMAAGTVKVEGLTLAESMTLAQNTLQSFGYQPGKVGGPNPAGPPTPAPKPSFRTDTYNPATAPIAEVAARQLDPTKVEGTLLSSKIGSDFLPLALGQVTKAVARKVDLKEAAYKAAKARKVPKSKMPKAVQEAERAAARHLAEMTTLLSELSGVDPKLAKPLTIPQRRTLRLGMQALEGVDQKAAKAVDTMLRQYRTLDRSAAKSVTSAAKELETRLSAIVDATGLQVNPARPNKTGGFARSPVRTPGERTRVTESRGAGERSLVEAVMAEAGARKDSAALREELRQIAEREAYTADKRTLNTKADKATTASLMPPSPTLKPSTKTHIGRVMDVALMPFMTPRQIDDTYKHSLPKIRYKRSVVSFIEGLRRARQEGDTTATSIIQHGQAMVNEIVDWSASRRQSGTVVPGTSKTDAASHQAYLGGVMADATIYEVTFAGKDRQNFDTREEFEDSFLRAGGVDSEGLDVTEDGVNSHVFPERMPAALDLWDRFDALGPEGKVIYRKVAEFHRRNHNLARDMLLMNVLSSDTLLGPNHGIRTMQQFLAEAPKLSKEVNDAARSIMQISRLKGDYFPLSHGQGKFQSFARSRVTAKGRNASEAKANLAAMMRADPRIATAVTNTRLDPAHPGGRVGTEHIATAELTFYYRHDTMKQAQAQSKALRDKGFARRDMGTITFDFVSEPTLVREVDFDQAVPDGLREELLKVLATAPAALKDATMELLNKRQAVNLLSLSRDNVLGESQSLALNLQRSLARTGMQISALMSQTDVTRIRTQTEEQLQLWRDSGVHARDVNVTRRVQQQVNTLENQRNAAYENLGSFWSATKQFGTGAGVVYYLSSVSYYALNMTQPAMIGIPYMLGQFGRRGAAELMAVNFKNMRTIFKAVAAAPMGAMRTIGAETGISGSSPTNRFGNIDYIKTVITSDPKAPGVPLDGNETTTFDPATGAPVVLANTQFEYDQLARGEITAEFLRFLSENRLRGTLGSAIHEQGEAVQEVDSRNADYPVVSDSADKLGAAAQNTAQAVKRIASLTLSGVSYLAEHVEYVNRRSVVEAVYNLNKAANPGVPLDETAMAQVADLADRMNANINFDMAATNRSQAQNTAGPLLLFSSYGYNLMYATWTGMKAMTGLADNRTSEEAKVLKVAFMGLIATHFLVGGLQAGVPQWATMPLSLASGLLSPVTAAFYDLMRDIFGDEEDDFWSVAQDFGIWEGMQSWTRANMGDLIADGVFNGVVATALQVDLQSRVSLNQGYTFVDAGIPASKEELQQTVFDLAGPLAGMAMSLVDGLDRAKTEGMSTQLFLERFFPIKAVRDIARSQRFGEEGLRTRSGNIRLAPEELGFFDGMLAQALGFTPMDAAKVYARTNLEYEAQDRVRGERAALLTQYRRIDLGDGAARAALRQKIRDFNASASDPKDKIGYSTLRSSLRQSQEDEATFRRNAGIGGQSEQVAQRVNQIYGD